MLYTTIMKASSNRYWWCGERREWRTARKLCRHAL